MLKTNENKLVEFKLQCQPGPPKSRGQWGVDRHGNPFILPSIGGITMNIHAGDSAFGWEGDHIEPGVSCIGDTHKPFDHPNVPLQVFTCSGNKAVVIKGDAKGEEGIVLGHHGGSEHLIVEFSKEAKEKMTYEDGSIIIRARGQGLKLTDYPDIFLYNLDPEFLHKMDIKEKNGKLQVPVTTVVPASCMGSGVGATQVATGDYDIMTGDPETVKQYKLDQIRFGDIVALMDHDNRYGRDFHKGAITIGIVVHSDCKFAGHGPGVTTLMTCVSGQIEPVIDPKANIADIYGIGTQL